MPLCKLQWKIVSMVGTLTAAVMLMPAGSAVAEPRPTVAQAKARLAKLEGQADKTVERYNTVADAYKASKKKYDRLNQELSRENSKVQALRDSVVTTASGMYQAGAALSWPGLVGKDDPAGLLAGLAVGDQVSAGRARTLEVFDLATRTLRDRRGKAKDAYDEATKLLADVAKEKKKVEKLVGEQERLLRRLNQFNAGDPNSRGIRYDGPASGSARAALQFAYAQVGKPYRWGGTGPSSYDCSGLTQAAWARAGVNLPRTTYQQWAWGASRRVSMNDLQPGDLLFSNGLGHMGMYAGDGKMVHAPRTGDVIKVVSLDVYWRGRLIGAIRP